MRSRLKGAAETLLARGGPATLCRTLSGPGTLVLAYHNVVPDDAPPVGDQSLHMRRSLFAAHLDEIVRHSDVVPLESIQFGIARGRKVALTFDDAYQGAVTTGVAELARRELPGTIFVPPAFIGGDGFWWDVLASVDRCGLDPSIRRYALARLGGRSEAIQRWARTRGLAPASLPSFARVASTEELRAALAHPGITFGSHSWSHPDLSQLDRVELAAELTRSRDWLVNQFGDAFRPWLSFPYGFFSAPVVEEALQAGYQATFRIDGGWCRTGASTRHPLPRLNVPANLSRNGLALRIAGLLCR